MPQLRAGSPSSEEQSKRPIDSPVDPSKPQKIARVDSGDQQSESVEPEARKMGFQSYLVAVEYIGTRFSGSQKQLNCRTVEGILEDAFHKFIGQPVSVSFSSRTAQSPVRTLDELGVCEVIPSCSFPSITDNAQKNERLFGERKRHHLYMITARARSFLYHQVRLLVCLLKSVGTGDLKIDDVERILNARTVSEAPSMAPACGLYLGNVMYDFSSDDDQNS